MKKKSIFQLLAAALIVAIVTTCFMYGGILKPVFHPKLARASLTVTCDCALLRGNNNCLANNYGASYTSTENCQAYNSNCGG